MNRRAFLTAAAVSVPLATAASAMGVSEHVRRLDALSEDEKLEIVAQVRDLPVSKPSIDEFLANASSCEIVRYHSNALAEAMNRIAPGDYVVQLDKVRGMARLCNGHSTATGIRTSSYIAFKGGMPLSGIPRGQIPK